MRISYLGPAGTFTEDALGEATAGTDFEPLRTTTIEEAILAVDRGDADRALVPIENSIEGSVRPTLDTLAFEANGVAIAGEHDYRVRVHLIGREGVGFEQVEAVFSHPQPLAQCARFLRDNPILTQLAIAHIRKMARGVANIQNTHPFVRVWHGRHMVFAHNGTLPYVLELANRGWRDAVRADPALALGVNTHDGHVVYGPVAEAHGMAVAPLAEVLR